MDLLYFNFQSRFYRDHDTETSGVYILQNTMARGGGELLGANEKNEEQNEKEGKRGQKKGERKKKKRKRGRVFFFVNIWHTLVDNCIPT